MDPYSELHPDSKVWVYQADRELNPYELLSVRQQLDSFIKSWASHGKDVKAHGEIIYNRFIILFADETQAGVSGCSIDSSVHFIQGLEKQFDINFFNRMLIAYKVENELKVSPYQEFEDLCKNGTIDSNTIVFNNLVNNKREFESNWEIPASQSWHSRFFS